MSFSPSSPVTGAAQAGLTAPTYTLISDVAPTPNGKQWYVSALGGTQTGVDVHAIARPFTLSIFRPYVFKVVQLLNVNGLMRGKNGRNVYKVVTRKGVSPLANQPSETMVVTVTVDVPAGADTADSANVKAALSLAFGACWAQSSGIGDTALTGAI
jgi:hypothetical protein